MMPAVLGVQLGLNAAQIEHAIGISGSQGFPLGILDVEGEEYSMTKSIRFARASHQALMSCYLAARGFTGPRRVVEGRCGYVETVTRGSLDLSRLDLRSTKYSIEDTFVKMFLRGTSNQGHLTATQELVTAYDLRPEQIERIVLRVTDRCATHCGGDERGIRGPRRWLTIASTTPPPPWCMIECLARPNMFKSASTMTN